MSFAGIIELSVEGKGPKRAFVFDSHRLALPCWAEVKGTQPALLLTLDRHFDTVPPVYPPQADMSVAALELHAREKLDHRNFDHILAAMSAEVISDAIIIARAKPLNAVVTDWEGHQLISSPTLDLMCANWGTPQATPEGKRAYAAIERAQSIILDVDLDCFTTPCDAEPTTVVPWPVELIDDFVFPKGSPLFWKSVLSKCVGFTFAREPAHCGGLIAAGKLFESACQILFKKLFEADLP